MNQTPPPNDNRPDSTTGRTADDSGPRLVRALRRQRSDSRAVSPVIGVVLMLAVAMILIGVIQTTVIPQLNSQHEFEHNQEAQADMVGLSASVDRVAVSGDRERVTVDLGTRYSARLLFVNPPPASGAIRTTEARPITISNAVAAGEAGDYWNGSTKQFFDRHLVYSPGYNEFDAAPETVLENLVLYNRFDQRDLPVSREPFVDGRQVTLVTLNGSLSRSGTETIPLELNPLSAPRQVTPVQSTEPLEITVPTRLSEETWDELFATQRVENGGYVTDVSVTEGQEINTLQVTLRANETYDLRMAKIGIGTQLDRPTEHYITTVSATERRIPSGSTELVTFEVRDRYNNPVSGVRVNGSVSGVGTLVPVSPVTDSAGRATFRYEAIGTGSATVAATFGDNPTDRQIAETSIESVQSTAAVEETLSLEWTAPSVGEDDAYTFDAGAADTVPLTVTSNPSLEGVDIQYIVDDASIGTVSRNTGATDANGRDTVSFSAKQSGTVDVYAIGGGDADVMRITVTNLTQNAPPSASFSWTPTVPGTGESVSFDGTDSTDPDENIQSYEWEFGDGTTATGATPSHTYQTAGTYPVTLTVTDSNGVTDTERQTVTVGNPPSVDSVTVTDQSKTTGTPKYAQFLIEYAVSDDIQLDSLRFTVVRQSDSVKIIDTTTPISGTSASGSETIREADQNSQVRGQTYDVTITAINSEGKTTSVTRTVTVR